MTGSGVAFLFVYQMIRQLRQIDTFYAMSGRIDLFNPRPLYGFSRYTATLSVIMFFIIGVSLIDPTAYAAFSATALITYFVGLTLPTLLIFYLPLAGAHHQLVAEKDRLLREVTSRIETMLERLHLVALEQQDYKDVGGMRSVLSALKEEKETIEDLSTWPWRPGTFTRLLSAIFLPVVLALNREVVSRLI
jgi:hypothetical protein